MSRGRRSAPSRPGPPADIVAPPQLPQPLGGGSVAAGQGATSDRFADGWAGTLIKAAVIAIACAWIYSPSLHGDWLWDDDTSVWKNPVTMSPSYSFWKFWVAPEGADYFPLTATGFWVQWQLFGPGPTTPPEQVPALIENVKTAYHAVNIALHVAGALLLWRLVNVMKLPGGWFAGMLFAVHPIGVESVSWISELKNTLCQPLFLLAAIHFVLFDDAETETRDWDSPAVWGNYALALACFILAMLAKTSVVMFPVVILLYVWWKRGLLRPVDIAHSAPFFLVSLLLGLMTIYYQHGRAVGQEKMPIDGIMPRFAIAGMAIPFYLWKTFWPVNLLPIYPQWQVQPVTWQKAWQYLPWPLMAGTLAWIWQYRGTAERPRWGRHVLFAFGFFVLMLLPILGFITISYMRITWVCDHFLYLPMISLLVLVTVAVAKWADTADQAEQQVIVVGGAVLLALLAFGTYRYSGAWFNEDKQWTHTLASNPNAWQAHNRLGAWKAARGDIPGAHEHFKNSSRLRPDLGETHNNLGTTYLHQGNMDEAIAAFERAIEATPHVPLFYANLLSALLESGRQEKFDTLFAALLDKENPAVIEFLVRMGQDAMGMENAANAAAKAGRTEEAKQIATRAIARCDIVAQKYKTVIDKHPRNAVAWNNYGVMLMKVGKKQEAIAALERAVEIAPTMPDARMALDAARREMQAEAGPGTSGSPPPAPPPLMQEPSSPTLGPPPLFGK